MDSTELELSPASSLEIGKIHQGDCLTQLRQIETGSIELVFADPPFNIGYEYDQYHDRQEDEEYIAWSREWMEQVQRILKPDGTFWLAIGDEYAAELKVDAEYKLGFFTRSWVVWYYTFGVNCTRKFSRSHAHLFHFVKDENNFTFNAEDPLVRVPSARALVYGDKRANPAGRLPDDTWILRPQDLADGFQATDDTWYYARVAGTFKERQGFHGCQMPEQLLGRIIRVSSNPGDVVLDPFAGSGTTLAVAKKLGRRWIGCELSDEYVCAATARLNSIQEGEALDGPVDPIASAPSTANGRKLERGMSGGATGFASALPIKMPADSGCPTLAKPVAHVPNRLVLRELVNEAIADAFYAAHDGYSIDWLLADPSLQSAFHDACRKTGLFGSAADWNRELLRLRKTGLFPKRGTVKKVHFSEEELDAFSFAAEMAWRKASDRFSAPSLDEILCDPAKAAYFDHTAKRFAPSFAPAQFRWAALRLRKASRALVDDVNQYHYIFAKRDFSRFYGWRNFRPDRLTGQRGIYLLRAHDKSPLYVGHTLDLARRLARHVQCPATSNHVTHVGVISGADLPGDDYLKSFQEELIRRHQPMWNVNLVGLGGMRTA